MSPMKIIEMETIPRKIRYNAWAMARICIQEKKANNVIPIRNDIPIYIDDFYNNKT